MSFARGCARKNALQHGRRTFININKAENCKTVVKNSIKSKLLYTIIRYTKKSSYGRARNLYITDLSQRFRG